MKKGTDDSIATATSNRKSMSRLNPSVLVTMHPKVNPAVRSNDQSIETLRAVENMREDCIDSFIVGRNRTREKSMHRVESGATRNRVTTKIVYEP